MPDEIRAATYQIRLVFTGMRCPRERWEQVETEVLRSDASFASRSKGRPRPEPQDELRTCFQRDRDRILHAKSFRRLKHKTQVFITPEGDHFRTRLTHTLEVAQISRTVARALRLNEDLTEAIALGHDVGHPPFGHAGEAAIDEVLRETFEPGNEAPSQFRHYDQSLRALMILEDLNLSHEVAEGIRGHSKGERDLTDSEHEAAPSWESAVVRICDRVAYLNHDLDDALRSGIIDQIPTQFESLGDTHGHRIGTMVSAFVAYSLEVDQVVLPEELLEQLNQLKNWLFENVYFKYPVLLPDISKAKSVVRELLLHYLSGGELPPGFEGRQGAVDYVAGMTDRFAVATYEDLKLPKFFRFSMP